MRKGVAPPLCTKSTLVCSRPPLSGRLVQMNMRTSKLPLRGPARVPRATLARVGAARPKRHLGLEAPCPTGPRPALAHLPSPPLAYACASLWR